MPPAPSHSPDPPPADDEWDPVFIHSRREARLIVLVWLVAMLWTVPYCYFTGFRKEGESPEVTFILGMPDWVFWGIAAPWMVANLFTVWFCFGYFVDDDLGRDPDEADSDAAKESV